MHRTIGRVFVAALLGGAVALSGTGAALAAPTVRTPPLSISVTDVVYGQPDLAGVRTGGDTGVVTITNTSGRTVETPLVTVPYTSLLQPEENFPPFCRSVAPVGGTLRCWAYPLAAGESRELPFRWTTGDRGPATSARVRVDEARSVGGSPVPRTTNQAAFRVSFAPVTGTFDIAATDLALAQKADGIFRGTVGLTVTNVSAESVPFPVVRFFGVPSAETGAWTDCVSVLAGPDSPACLLAPLGAGETRELSLVWASSWPPPLDPTVQVDAAPDATGTVVIAGTGAGDTVRVIVS